MNVDSILFRCHRLGDLLTDSKATITEKQLELIDTLQGKMTRTQKQQDELERLLYKRDHPELSQTTKSYCKHVFIEAKTGRKKITTNKYIEKGLRQEETSLTLLSLVKKVYLRKNKERLVNRYISGEPDAFIGDNIRRAKWGYDIKTVWDVFTMPYFERVNPDYEAQAQGYCALTGAAGWSIVHCLVNAPADMIRKAKENIFYAMGTPDETNEEYIEAKIEIEKSMIFDMELFKKENPFFDLDCKNWEFDIPREDRLIEFRVERNAATIESIYEKVEEGRKWIKDNLL